MTSDRPNAKDDNKADVVLEEYAANTKDGIEDVETARDGFGARKKVDPIEIRLVRKLDWYMMVSNNPCTTITTKQADFYIADSMAHVFLQLLGQKCHDQREIELAGGRPQFARHSV